ncbi:Ankyrin-2 [Lobaria immixta]|nr:Ankyrin-2 [Lobaria immixta]
MKTLYEAAEEGDEKTVEILIKAGADVNAVGGHYGSALQAAAFRGSKEIVEILIKAGADVSAVGGHYGSALQAAIANATECQDLIRLLFENSASVNLQSRASDGSCLLHAVVTSRKFEILKNLLDVGAEKLINVKNISGQTPFHLSVMSGNLRILEMLHSPSKDSNLIFEEIDVDGRTSLHLAVENEATEVVKWLLDRGARADVRDFGDSTPFQQAFQEKNLQILSLLFPRTAKDDKLLSASQWRSVQYGGSDKVIAMTSGEFSNVEMMSNQQLSQYISDRSYTFTSLDSNMGAKEKSMAENTPEKRIFLLPDDSVIGNSFPSGVQWRWWRQTKQKESFFRRDHLEHTWTPQLNVVPSAATIRQFSSGKCFLECRLAVPVFPSRDWQELPDSLKDSFKCLMNLHAVVWIMVKPKLSELDSEARRSILETRTVFSTLEFAAVPDTATDLFAPLAQQLQEEWNGVYKAADQHLTSMRTKVLESNGSDSKLIRLLLSDARLWGTLRKLLEDQITTLRSLQGSYENKNWTVLHEEDKDTLEGKLKSFRDETDSLNQKVNELLVNLASTSQTLIQLVNRSAFLV